ncbi:MAG: PAS domain S-box protein [Calditrichia bacterium]
MNNKSTILDHLVQILDILNNFIGNYPIYIYLIDKNYNLIWFNNYLADKFPGVQRGNDTPCYKALWGFEELCKDCPSFDKLEHMQSCHEIFEGKLPDSQTQVYLDVISLPVRDEESIVEGILKIGVDVTENEKEQRALREKEKLFVSIIDTSADAIFLLDNEDRILSWNKGAEDIFGYGAEEVIGKSNVILIPNELIELGELYYIKQELEKRGFIRRYETQRIDKYGQLIYVDLTRTVIRNENGDSIGSSVIIKDITSRKELEFELRRTIMELSKLNELDEIFYTTYILDDILQMILISITAGEGLRFNRAFLFLIDEKKEKLQGYLAIGPTNEFEAHQIWSSLQDHFRSLKDIVKQFQINLQGSDQKINEIVKQVQVPLTNSQNVLVKALKGRRAYNVRHGRVLDAGEYNFNMDGGDLFQVLGTNNFLVVPLVTKKEHIGVILADNKITQKDITEEEIESLKLFANQASMAIENARLYKNLEDRIQELQQAYQRLEENSERLVKAERLAAIGEMSAKVAHEIRNPLVSIGGFSRLLEKKLPSNSDLKNYTSIISSQVANLESILNNILSIANPKKPERRKVDIHQVIHQVLMMMDDVIHKRDVEVVLQFRCSESTVWGDEKLLFQVLLNLVKNAIEAMLTKRVLTFTTLCEDQYIRIFIQDSGHGIPQEHLQKIYDPFFTTKADGTGLGLAIVRQIVLDHKGFIEVESVEGEGTTVRLSIPRYVEPVENSEETQEKGKQ